jgi:hypothetical protein
MFFMSLWSGMLEPEPVLIPDLFLLYTLPVPGDDAAVSVKQMADDTKKFKNPD